MTPLGAVKTVTAAGTPEVLTTSDIVATRIWVQPMRALSALGTSPVLNTGFVYLKTGTVAKGTGSTDIILAVDPNALTAIPLESAMRDGWHLNRIYIDADNSGDGVLISYA